MRNYNDLEADRTTIVSEILSKGHSSDWFFGTETEGKLASTIEKDLRKYNIGYTDDKKGRWSYRLNGTRHFVALKFLNFARAKVNGLVENLKL